MEKYLFAKSKINTPVIREYTVKQPLPTRQGMAWPGRAGPQQDSFKDSFGQTINTEQTYPRGGQQVKLLIDTWKDANKPTAEWSKYLDRNLTPIEWGVAQRGG